MNIKFESSIVNVFTNTKKLSRKYGRQAKRIEAIISGLASCDIRSHMSLPGNPHPLKNYGKNLYSITVQHPFRLIYRVDSHQDITVLCVLNYHDHHSIYAQIKA